MRKTFEPGFYFTRTERRGITSLICMIVLMVAVQVLAPHFWNKDKGPLFVILEDYSETERTSEVISDSATSTKEPFPFNPNLLDQTGFQQLGLSAKTAQSIINYRSKGGRFRKPEDFQKIYTLDQRDYERLLPYIELDQDRKRINGDLHAKEYSGSPIDPNTADSMQLLEVGFNPVVVKNLLNYRRKGGFIKTVADVKKIWDMDDDQYKRVAPHLYVSEKTVEEREKTYTYKPKPITEEERNIRLDINTASEAEFEFLYGIGPGYAKRIVTFREKLGGFHTIDQVGETWGLPDSTFQQIKPNLIIQTPPGKIKINQADIETLGHHPYIDWKKAKLLVRYREQHGDYHSKEDILNIKVLTSEWVDRVDVYFDYSPAGQ